MQFSDRSGVILAGGQGKRMGSPKPFLLIDGRRMIDIVMGTLGELFSEILVVTDRKGGFEGRHCKVVEDVVEGCGPLGGIYTGLKEISGESAFFVACDMPFLDTGLVSRILNLDDFKNYECIVPRHSGEIEPMHAVYSRKIIPKIERCLESGRLALRELLADCSCKYVEVDKREIGSFTNINRPEDLARCRDLLP